MTNIKLREVQVVIILIFLFYSCTSKINQEGDNVEISVELTKGEIAMSSIFDNFELVFLETNEQSIINIDNAKIVFADESVFIKSNNEIKIFNNKGQFLRSIVRKGSGAGEYTGISDFYIDDIARKIEVLDKFQKKVLVYDFKGNHLEDINLSFWALGIDRDLEGRLLIYSGNERDADNIYKLHQLKDDVQHSIIEIDKNKSQFLHVSTNTTFYDFEGRETLFFEPFNDTIYSIGDLEILPKYTLKFNDGNSNIPSSFYNKKRFTNSFEFFQEFNSHSYVNGIYNVIETHDKVMFYCFYKGDKYLIVHDKSNNRSSSYIDLLDDLITQNIKLPFDEDEFFFFGDSGKVAYLLQPSWFIENQNYLLDSKYKTVLEELNEEDNPVLIVGTMK